MADPHVFDRISDENESLKALLRKYVDIVGQAEGVNFLYASEWTTQELALWRKIDPNLNWFK